MSLAFFSSTDAMVGQTPAALVVIGQVVTRATSITTSHDVDRGIGSATIRVPALFSWIVVGASVSIQLGYEETGTAPAFTGIVVKTDRSFGGDGGWEYVITCDGQLSRLRDGEEQALQYPRIYLGDLARSIAEMRGVKPLTMDRIKGPNNWLLDRDWITLGGNRYVDDGGVVIPARRGLYGWLSQKLKLFGYRIFDRPLTDVKIGRISGTPFLTQHTATEGVDIFRGNRPVSLNEIRNYWEVFGASYTDDDGIPIAFRSIAEEIPYDHRLRPRGFAYDSVSDGILSSEFLVNTVREVQEIDHSEPLDTTTWEMPGNIAIQPGDGIMITSEILGHSQKPLWITAVRNQWSDQGFWTTIDTWSGNGSALPQGADGVEIPVVTAPVHVGDEEIAWYARPNPSGRDISFEIAIPDDYTAILLEWWSHGCNSYFLDGASNESKVSKIIVEQGGEEVGSADLPMQPEEYELRRPYGSGLTHWKFNRVPVPGRLSSGIATVRLISGEDNRLPQSTKFDDYEIQRLVVKLTGVGKPILPGKRA